MAFISEEQRTKLQKKIYRGYGFRKWIIFSTLVCGIICAIYILFGILGQLQIIKLEELNFVKSDEKGGLSLTSYGIGACVIVSITIIGGLISIFCMLSMASPYKVANKISYLQSSAKPGTRNKSVASQTFKDRV